MKRQGPVLDESTRATNRCQSEGGESREVEAQNREVEAQNRANLIYEDRATWIFGRLCEMEELVRVEVDKLTAEPFPTAIQDIIVSCIVGPYSWRSEIAFGSWPDFDALLFSEFLVDPDTHDPDSVETATDDEGFYFPECIEGMMLDRGLYYSNGAAW